MVAWRTSTNVNETHTVLIVSQDTEMVSVWEALFEQKNCRVIVESTAHTALQTARLLTPALIVLELDLPEAERLSLCKGLRAATNGTLLVFVPRGSSIELSNYLFAGVNEILPAPISPMALLIKSMAWLVRQEWHVPHSQPERAYI
jgi:DNA-binding response OmpR family regulator